MLPCKKLFSTWQQGDSFNPFWCVLFVWQQVFGAAQKRDAFEFILAEMFGNGQSVVEKINKPIKKLLTLFFKKCTI